MLSVFYIPLQRFGDSKLATGKIKIIYMYNIPSQFKS